MNNFSRQKITLQTMANTTFNPNEQCCIVMPEGLLDLQTFRVQGNLTTAGGLAHGCYSPPIELLIDSVNVMVGSQSLTNGFTEYGNLFNIFRQYQLGDKIPLRRVLQHDLTAYTSASNHTMSNVPFSINNWLGPLNSIPILDTTIMQQVTVYIRLAPLAALSKHTGNDATISYQWTNVSASVDILDVSDGVYYNMIASKLAQSPIEIPYDNYQTVVGNYGPATQSTRLSTTTDCLTDFIATFKSAGYTSNTHNAVTGLSDYYTRGLGTNAGGLLTSVFQVNGVQYPTQVANNAAGHIFSQTGDVLGVSQDTVGASESNVFSSLATWSSNAFVHANSFTYTDSDLGRLVGLSGRGNSIQASWITTGTGNILPIVYMRSKSVLRVGGNRMCEIVL
jgi:hypothetical protein